MSPERFQTIEPLFKDCRNAGITLGLEFTHRAIPSPHGKDVFRLRDSLHYRLSAVGFQFLLLEFIDAEGHDRELAEVTAPFFLIQQAERASFLFDNLVFNLMSLFDYTAGLLFFVYYFDRIEDLERQIADANWQRLVLQSYDRNRYVAEIRPNRIFESKAGAAINTADLDFVNKLRAYRNDIIHNVRDSPGGSTSVSWSEQSGSSITITTPNKFKRVFSYPDDSSENILDCSLWMIEKALAHVRDLLEATVSDVLTIHNKNMDCLHLS